MEIRAYDHLFQPKQFLKYDCLNSLNIKNRVIIEYPCDEVKMLDKPLNLKLDKFKSLSLLHLFMIALLCSFLLLHTHSDV